MAAQAECKTLTVQELCTQTNAAEYIISGVTDRLVSGITMDSRSVGEGDLFCCVRGANFDGHAFAVNAVKSGASALLVEHYLPEVENVSQIIVANVRAVIGHYAKTLYGDPSTKLRVVGITGTNGKTTTASLLSSILNAAGVTSQALGTLTNERTTPEAPTLQKQLAQAVENDMQVVIMEVTSHAIDQRRINGIQFEVAVFTNISRDHLDYHGTQEAYFAAKAALFRQDHAIRAVVNADDTRGRLLFDASTIPTATFSLDDITAVKITASAIEFEWEGVRIVAPIGGRFNVMNLLAACTVARELGLTPKEIARAATQVQSVPGRFERVDAGQDFTVVVDFAHTPEGLAEVLQAGRAVCTGRVHVVFGCGGFLWWNAAPARIFMGDVGALGIGAALGMMAVATNTQLLLPLICALNVMEAGSVAIQMTVFKASGRKKRLFRMSPIHHHFELKGWPETTVIIRFWIISGICVAASLAIFIADFTRLSDLTQGLK